MWDQIFKRWFDLVFWWLPKPEATEPAAQASQPAAARAPEQASRAEEPAAARAPKQTAQAEPAVPGGMPKPAAAEQAARPSAPDDLTVIKGIGPAVQQQLHALGIRTFGDLAAADPATLTEQLKGRQPISPGRVRSWTEAANEHSAARH